MKRSIQALAGAVAGLALLAGCAKPPAETTGADETEAASLYRAAKAPSQATDPYYEGGLDAVLARAGGEAPKPRAKNVIIFIGDGMGVSTVTAGRIYAGQRKGVDGESYRLAMETLPYSAFSKTYSHDSQVADSASTATAIYTGVKTRSRLIGLTADASYGNCASAEGRAAETLFELAEEAGMATGLVSTARLTHATPASAYGKSPNRDWESDRDVEGGCTDLAVQFLDWAAGDGFEVALAGGREMFLPGTMADPEYPDEVGVRGDGRDLTAEWQARGGPRVVIWDKAGFDATDFASETRVLGLFEPSHMEYDLDRVSKDSPDEPSLAELTVAAITRLSQDGDGYILLVEGGRIDHGHHAGNAARALADTAAFDEAVAAALAMVDLSETLIIVTADHSHTLVIQGYQARNTPILGVASFGTGSPARAADGKGYTTLSYANGPGAVCLPGETECVRPDPSEQDTQAPDYRQQSLLPMGSETHGGEDVPVFAGGPGAELVRGVMEQNEIFHVIGFATGLIRAE